MSDRIEVTASLRIARNADDVRAQYRDMDHHIRNGVHSGIKLEWLEPQAPGERRIKTTFRILGIPQSDVAILEELPDGTFVIRNLEGTNAGMVVYHRFIPIDPATTEVQLVADAPSTLGRKLLGPLFRAGARQVLKKALAEDKRDLEGSGYTPNLAGGNVERALADVGALPSPDAGRAGVVAAAVVGLVSQGLSLGELTALRRLALAAGVADDAIGPTVEAADTALNVAR